MSILTSLCVNGLTAACTRQGVPKASHVPPQMAPGLLGTLQKSIVCGLRVTKGQQTAESTTSCACRGHHTLHWILRCPRVCESLCNRWGSDFCTPTFQSSPSHHILYCSWRSRFLQNNVWERMKDCCSRKQPESFVPWIETHLHNYDVIHCFSLAVNEFLFCSGYMLVQRSISGAVVLFCMLFSVGLFLLMTSMYQLSLKKSVEVFSTFLNTSTVQLPLYSCICCRLILWNEQPSRTYGNVWCENWRTTLVKFSFHDQAVQNHVKFGQNSSDWRIELWGWCLN